jgi:hypothetical protein
MAHLGGGVVQPKGHPVVGVAVGGRKVGVGGLGVELGLGVAVGQGV